MKVVCAYLLACLGGNTNPTSADLKNILSAVGIEANDGRLELFMSQIDGKSLEEVMAFGRQKLASVPSGGGGNVTAMSSDTGAVDADVEPEPKSKKEEKEEEESDNDMFSLFDD